MVGFALSFHPSICMCVCIPASQRAEDLSARLVVDGVPYRESVSSYALLTRHVSSGMLERDVVLSLQV